MQQIVGHIYNSGEDLGLGFIYVPQFRIIPAQRFTFKDVGIEIPIYDVYLANYYIYDEYVEKVFEPNEMARYAFKCFTNPPEYYGSNSMHLLNTYSEEIFKFRGLRSIEEKRLTINKSHGSWIV